MIEKIIKQIKQPHKTHMDVNDIEAQIFRWLNKIGVKTASPDKYMTSRDAIKNIWPPCIAMYTSKIMTGRSSCTVSKSYNGKFREFQVRDIKNETEAELIAVLMMINWLWEMGFYR